MTETEEQAGEHCMRGVVFVGSGRGLWQRNDVDSARGMYDSGFHRQSILWWRDRYAGVFGRLIEERVCEWMGKGIVGGCWECWLGW
jgi:hypothetical protein